ncbi:MAG TPA: hypothetical protein VGD96_09340, partial [Bradyrhizobium sp.]
ARRATEMQEAVEASRSEHDQDRADDLLSPAKALYFLGYFAVHAIRAVSLMTAATKCLTGPLIVLKLSFRQPKKTRKLRNRSLKFV